MAYLIKNQVFFNNSWHELNNFTYGKAFYPVEVSEKLSEELDSGELKFYTDSRENDGKEMLYPQMTMFSIEIDMGTDRARKFYFYGTDTAEKLNPYLWKHRVLLAEPTKDLEGVILDGLGFAQPEDNSQRMTLYDIVQRLLACTPLRIQGQPQKYTLISESEAPEIIDILKAQTTEEKLLPEFFWSSQTTLKEALCDIGAYCNLYPRLTLNPATNTYTVVTFDEVNKVREFLETIGGVTEISFQDNEQYVSALETNAQNVLSKSSDTNTIVYPSPAGWVTPRTEEVRLTTNNAEIELPFNINKVKKVYLCGEKLFFTLATNGDRTWYKGDTDEGYFPTDENIPFSECYDAKTGEKWDMALDITYLVKEKSEFNTINAVIDDSEDSSNVLRTINKANTIYYEKGTNKIFFGNVAEKYLSAKTPNIVNLLLKYITDFNNRAKTALDGGEGNSDFERKLYTYRNDGSIKIYTSNGTAIYYVKSNILSLFEDPRGIKFRIEYEPLDTSAKFRVSKSLPMDKPFIQNYNQRAEINSAEALGRNMKGTVNKMGVPTKNHLLIEQDLSKVPRVGDAYEKDGRTYIVSQVDYDCFSLYGMGVNLTLSQDWNMLSQYVGIDRRFRWEQIYNKPVERNLFYQDYLVIVPYESENTGESIYLSDITKATDVLKIAYEENTNVNNCYFYRGMKIAGYPDSLEGVVLSASSYATGGSMIFTAKTQDNLSAGKAMQDDQYCIDYYYCDADGTLDGNKIKPDGSYTLSGQHSKCMDIRLTTGIDAATLAPDKLPEYSTAKKLNATAGTVGYNEFYIDKNNSEQLNFVYELSWVSPCPYLVIGEKLAANNPLVRQWTENRILWFIPLKKRLPQGAVKVTEGYRLSQYLQTSDDFRCFEVTKENSEQIRLMIRRSGLLSSAVGWAITDETYSLLLACNDKTKTDFKIITSHEYHGKPWKI